MRTLAAVVTGFVISIVVGVAVGLSYVRTTGLTARGTPSALETSVARRIRAWAIPPEVRDRPNPVPLSDEVVAMGLAHFADHCASCHANDGSGDVEMGRGLFPKSPDMRQAQTQTLTDGELFWIIENGIRFTGMPAWSTGTADGERASWNLVHFIRRLPRLTPAEIEEMEAMNPRSPAEIRQDIEAEKFLRGEGSSVPPPATPHVH